MDEGGAAGRGSASALGHALGLSPLLEAGGPGLVEQLLDLVGDAILVYDRVGLIWASDALERVFGFAPRDVVGTMFALGDPEDVAAASTTTREAAARGADSVQVRYRGHDASRRPRWVDSTTRFLRGADGSPDYAVVLLHDVTELVEAENRYRLVAENASDVVLEVGPDALIRWVSPSVERVLGWRPEQLLGRDGAAFVHPDDDARMIAARVGQRAGETAAAEFRWRCADGSYRWISGISHDVRDERGATTSRVLIFNAIADDVRHERHLAELDRSRLRAVLDSELDPRVVLEAVRDETGAVVDLVHVDVNRAGCAWIGLPAHKLIGVRLRDLFPPDMAEVLVAQYAEVVESGSPLVLDETAMPQSQRDGQVGWFDVRGVRVGDGLTVSWRDVSDRHTAAAVIAESEQRYRLLAENVQDVVMHIVDGTVRWVSPSLVQVLGWKPADWIGKRSLDYVHPDDVPMLVPVVGGSEDGLGRTFRSRARDTFGAYHWTQGQAGVYHDAAGEPDGVIVSFRLADAEVAVEDVLRERAQHDDLTGLLNRVEVLAQLAEIVAEPAPVEGGAGTYVLLGDLDDFKHVNDSLGHAAGDDVLRIVGRRLRGVVRRNDLVARIGGDELLVVVRDVSSVADAYTLAEKLRLRAAVPIVVTAGKVDVTLSVGGTVLRPGESVDELVARAERAMAAAKKAGGNRVVVVPSSPPEGG